MAHLAEISCDGNPKGELAPGNPNDGSGALPIDTSDGLRSIGKMDGVALIDGHADVVRFA